MNQSFPISQRDKTGSNLLKRHERTIASSFQVREVLHYEVIIEKSIVSMSGRFKIGCEVVERDKNSMYAMKRVHLNSDMLSSQRGSAVERTVLFFV